MSVVPFIGQVQLFAGSFAPRDWAMCWGQVVPIASNQALFALIGTMYGGDGRSTMALPDLRGRAVVGAGNGPGLTPRNPGNSGGEESVTLEVSELPHHFHNVTLDTRVQLQAATEKGSVVTPADGSYVAAGYEKDTDSSYFWYIPESSSTHALGGVGASSSTELAHSGGGQAHENMQPWQALNYIIAMAGVFPSRN